MVKFPLSDPTEINSLTEEEIFFVLEKDIKLLKYLDRDKQTESFLLALLTKIGLDCFDFIDRKAFTPKILDKALRISPFIITKFYAASQEHIKLALELNIKVFPSIVNKCTRNVIKSVLSKEGRYLRYVKKQDLELIRIALENDISAAEFINPKTAETDALIIELNSDKVEYVENVTETIAPIVEDKDAWRNVLENFVDDDTTIKAIQQNPKIILNIKNPSFALQELAINLDPTLIEFLSQDPVLVDKALEKNGNLIKYIKRPMLRHYRIASKTSIFGLDLCPRVTEELVDYALQFNGNAIKYKNNLTAEIIKDALNKNIESIQYVPLEMQTEEMQLSFVRSEIFESFGYIKPLTKTVLLEILKFYPEAIFRDHGIPLDSELLIASTKVAENIIMMIPNWQTIGGEVFVEAMLKTNGLLIKHIQNPTQQQKLWAFQQNPKALQLFEQMDEDFQLIFDNFNNVALLDWMHDKFLNETNYIQIRELNINLFNPNDLDYLSFESFLKTRELRKFLSR